MGGRDDLGMIGEAEIVVGAKDDRLAPVDLCATALRAFEKPLALEETVGFDLRQGRAQMRQKRFGHGGSPRRRGARRLCPAARATVNSALFL